MKIKEGNYGFIQKFNALPKSLHGVAKITKGKLGPLIQKSKHTIICYNYRCATELLKPLKYSEIYVNTSCSGQL